MLDQVEERRLAPVDVVEDDDERFLAGERLEQPPDRPEALLGAPGRPLPPGEGGDVLRDQAGLRSFDQPLHSRADVALPDGLRDDLRHRPKCDPFAVGQAAANEETRTVADRVHGLGDEPRLAHACRTEDREQVAATLLHGATEGVLEQEPLTAAAYHRRGHPPRRRSPADGEQPVRDDALDLPLQCQRLQRLCLDRPARQPVSALAEEDLAGLGLHLEPLGDDDRLARNERLGACGVAGHDLAARDADPDLEPHAVGTVELLVKHGQAIAHVGGRAERPQCVVLVHDRSAEHGHDRVADELLHRAAVMLERHAHLVEVAGEHAPHQLRVARLAEARRARDVAEDDRHRLAHFERLLDRLRDRRRDRRGDLRLLLGRLELELRLLHEDRPLQPLEGGAGVEAELVAEQPACLPVGIERCGLTAGPVERKHQLPAHAFTKGLGGDERLELGDELSVPPERQVRVDPVFERGEPELREPGGLAQCERLVGELRERRTVPEAKRLTQACCAGQVLAARERRASLAEEAFEAGEVELLGRELRHVALCVRPNRRIGAERLAQLRDVHLNGLGG